MALNLSSISPHFLAQTAIRLEELNLCNTQLSPEQVTRLFTQIAESPNANLKLTKLNLFGVDLSSVPDVLLAQARQKLTQLLPES